MSRDEFRNNGLLPPTFPPDNPMKNHHHNGHVHSTTKSQIHEAIATRAYELWVSHGKPEDQSDAFWLEAEHELKTGRKAPQSNPAQPVTF